MPENEKIRKITTLLEKGGTMLASHHECGAPQFRYQGKVVCPVCDFPEEIKGEKEVKKGHVPEAKAVKPEAKAAPEGDYQTIGRIVMSKTLEIASSLEAETDLQRVRDKMECIESGIKILKMLRE